MVWNMQKENHIDGYDAVLELIKTFHYAISDIFALIDEWKWSNSIEKAEILSKVIAKMDNVNTEMMLCLGSISQAQKELQNN